MGLLSTIAPAIIGVTGGAIGWYLKSKFEAKRRVEESLRDEATKVYLEILMPFAVLFTSDLHLNLTMSGYGCVGKKSFKKKGRR